jgi:hypothetical protein
MNDEDVRDMLRRRSGDVTPGGGAWERIVERIAGDEVAPLTELAPARRRLWSPATGLGAAAAVLVLVVAMASLLRGGDGGKTVRAAVPPSTTPTAPVAAAPTFEGAAEQAARAWVEAVGAGDFDRAWDLLADQSREATGGRAGFEASGSALAEGWGAWAGVPGVSYRAVLLPGLAGDLPAELPRLAVVTLTGVVEQEGTTAFRALSMAVRGTAEDPRVDLFVAVGIELHPGPEASGGTSIPGRTKLGAYTPAAAKVWFVLDERAPADPDDVQGADGDQQFATLTPTPALTEGRHVLTVAALMVNGQVLTRSTVYTVAADAPQAVLKCGMVGFTPNSEDAASAITVTAGTSCDAARAFVEVAGRQTSSGGPDEVVVDGYRCVRTETAEDPLPRSDYRCTKGTTVITFVRT